MKTTLIVAAASLSLVAFVAGCGAEPEATREATPNGYGYEFKDEHVVALGATKTAKAMDAVAPGTKIAPELIQDVVRARAEAFKGCYDEALSRDPKASGTVTVRFSILADGTVEGAKTEGATGTDEAMASCVVAAVSDARFPASSAGLVMVIYPLVFSR